MALQTKKRPLHAQEEEGQEVVKRLRRLARMMGKRAAALSKRVGLNQLPAAGMGAVFAAAAVSPGMQPFGAAYVAASGHPLAAAAGAFCGYLLASGTEGLVYGAAATVVLTCRMVLEGTAAAKSRGFFPLCAALAVGCTKGVVLQGGLRSFGLLLCECLLCFGFGIMMREAREVRSPLWTWGRLTAALGTLLAALPLRLWGILSPARVGGIFLTLGAGCFGGGAVGACVGAVFGASLDLAQGQGPLLALCWSFSGLAAGLAGKRERLPAALLGCAACGLTCLWLQSSPGAREGLMECFLSASVLVLLPEKWTVGLAAAFSGASAGLERGRRPSAGGQALAGLSDAVAQLGAAMESLWQGGAKTENDLGRVYRTACETACRTCKRREDCWQENYGDLQRMLAGAAVKLRENHQLEPEQLPSWFTARCLRPRRFCGAINDAYRTALRRQALQNQERAVHRLMSRQYESLGALLEGVAARSAFGPEYDAALEGRVRRVIRAYLPRARTTVCLTGGRLQIDLLLPKNSPELAGDHTAMVRSLQGALEVKLLPPVVVDSAQGGLLRIRQQEALGLRAYAAVQKKEGEDQCGDCYLTLHTDDGRGILLLSDGMGTGEQAGQLSQRALELVRSFVQSGCGLAESTAAVLPVLAARFEEWGFVTLDLAEISLFTGKATLLKYGAAPGFLLREGRQTRLEARALPAGLEPMDGEPPALQLRLRAGDRLVLLSDGVWENQRTQDLLRENAQMDGQALANLLVGAASRGGEDDRTVLVADLIGMEELEDDEGEALDA